MSYVIKAAKTYVTIENKSWLIYSRSYNIIAF